VKYKIVQHFEYYPLKGLSEDISGEFNDIKETIGFARALRQEYGYNYIIDEEGEKVWDELSNG